jgi:hypothetical protein
LDDAKAYVGDLTNAPVAVSSGTSQPPSSKGGAREAASGGAGMGAGGERGMGGQNGVGVGSNPAPRQAGVDGTPVVRFGKHRGKTFRQVADSNPEYYHWARKQDNPGRQLQKFLKWCDAQRDSKLRFEGIDQIKAIPSSAKKQRSASDCEDSPVRFQMFFDGGSRANGTPCAVAGSGACIFE